LVGVSQDSAEANDVAMKVLAAFQSGYRDKEMHSLGLERWIVRRPDSAPAFNILAYGKVKRYGTIRLPLKRCWIIMLHVV
jgi:hypothetical protein